MYKLYHFPLSPFSRKVRLTLAEKKIEVELIEEKYWEPRAEFARLNPAGQIPVLVADGHVICDSNAICEYLEEKTPDPTLIPGTAAERAEVRRLVGYFDDRFYKDATLNLLGERVNKRLMKLGYPDSKNVKAGSKKIKLHLDYMAMLLDERRWLAGDKMSLADFAAAAQLSCLDYVKDVDWNRSDTVKQWYAKLKSRPAFRSLLTDQVSGFPVPEHYADLDF